jgi:hypothetical protein
MGTPSTGKRIHREREIEPLVVSPNTAARILDEGRNRIYERIDSGELESYKDGWARKITMRSIKALIERKLAGKSNNGSPMAA